MKKILLLLLLIPSVTFGQSFLRLPYAYLLHTYQGDTIKQYFSGDSAKWDTNKSAFAFNKPIYIQGHLVGSSGTESDPIFAASVAKNIKSSDTARWAQGASFDSSKVVTDYDLTTGNIQLSANTISSASTGGTAIEAISGSGNALSGLSSTGIPLYLKNGNTNTNYFIRADNYLNSLKFSVDYQGNVNIPTGSTYQINGVPIGSGGGSGTVTSVTGVNANHVNVTVANGSTIPAITASPDSSYWKTKYSAIQDTVKLHNQTASKLPISGTAANSNQLQGKDSTALLAFTKSQITTKQNATVVNLIDAASGNQTYTLPTSVGKSGNVYIVKKIDSSANTVTIATTSSQTIDGYSTIEFSNQYQCYSLVSNGSNWFIISIF